MDGNSLIRELSQATNLPSDLLEKNIRMSLLKAGLNPEDLTLDELREVAMDLLTDIFEDLSA